MRKLILLKPSEIGKLLDYIDEDQLPVELGGLIDMPVKKWPPPNTNSQPLTIQPRNDLSEEHVFEPSQNNPDHVPSTGLKDQSSILDLESIDENLPQIQVRSAHILLGDPELGSLLKAKKSEETALKQPVEPTLKEAGREATEYAQLESPTQVEEAPVHVKVRTKEEIKQIAEARKIAEQKRKGCCAPCNLI